MNEKHVVRLMPGQKKRSVGIAASLVVILWLYQQSSGACHGLSYTVKTTMCSTLFSQYFKDQGVFPYPCLLESYQRPNRPAPTKKTAIFHFSAFTVQHDVAQFNDFGCTSIRALKDTAQTG
ncbi:MAG: hypothetical protein JW795_11880 [Chitinivibrionales bacterium]|nr:hypothetical protein [Chitinivibrionales bacterium]